MQAVMFLLLAVYTSVATSGNFTWYLGQKSSDIPQTTLDHIEEAMSVATDFYSQHSPEIGDLSIKAVYNANQTRIVAVPWARAIEFGDNVYYSGKDRGWYWTLSMMSKLFGVGTTQIWADHCHQGVAKWDLATKLLVSYNVPDKVLHCDGLNFWPFGLNDPDEFNRDNAIKHCRLVATMVHEGL